jgi:hypothetical protein
MAFKMIASAETACLCRAHVAPRAGASERACALDRRSPLPAPFIRLTAVFAAWGQGFATPVRIRASIVNYGRDSEPQRAQEDKPVPQWTAQGHSVAPRRYRPGS